jgi:hypothetical protein
MSVSALFVSSTRNAMLTSEPIERDTRQRRATCAHVCESAVQRFDRFDPLEELLVGFGILHHHRCAPGDGPTKERVENPSRYPILRYKTGTTRRS